MAYTVFEDDAASPLIKKTPKSSPKKLKSPEKRSNGHPDGTPVASTSKALLPPSNPEQTAGSPAQNGNGDTSAVFKKRKASVNGLPDWKPKSKRRSLANEGSQEVDASDLATTAGNEVHSRTATSSAKAKSRETTPVETSKRIATFYDDEDQVSDDEGAGSPGKSRGIETQPGESKKQARKRLQAERKDKAEHLLSARKSLPVYAVKDAILKEIEARDTVVILGETGSGKTTREWAVSETRADQLLLSSDSRY